MKILKNYKEIADDILHLLKTREVLFTEEIVELLKKKYKLTEEQICERVRCGRQTVFKNRVIIARTYLIKQRLIIFDGRIVRAIK